MRAALVFLLALLVAHLVWVTVERYVHHLQRKG